MTVEWLTDTLCHDHPGARVESFEHGDQYNGMMSGRRLWIHYNDAGRDAGLPERLFAKFSPTVAARCLVGINGSSAGEVAFYNDIATSLPIEVPNCYYAAFEERSCRTFVLLEDLVQTRNARFGTSLDLAIDRGQAESMVALMATLHGGSGVRAMGLRTPIARRWYISRTSTRRWGSNSSPWSATIWLSTCCHPHYATDATTGTPR